MPQKRLWAIPVGIAVIVLCLLLLNIGNRTPSQASKAPPPPVVNAPEPVAVSAPEPVVKSTTAQLIASASGLEKDDPTVADNISKLAEMCNQTVEMTGDQVAKSTSLINEVHQDVTMADFLREAVKTQPISGGDCPGTFGLMIASIRNVP